MQKPRITVRFVRGTHQTNTICGQRASSTAGYVNAARTLALKVWTRECVRLHRLPAECKTGVEVFEVEVLP